MTMYNGRTVAVIIPAYNEQHHVARVIESVPAFVDRIYAIDDASHDGTWDEIRSVAARLNRDIERTRYPRRVVPIRHDENQGAGGAVITGYRHALADEIDVTAVMDGDGQMDPSDLDRIVEPVAHGEVDYAKGNRLHHRTDFTAMSRWRLFGNALLTMLTRIASGYWEMSDPQNGYTAISRDALSRLPLDRLYPSYGFLNDVLVHLNLNRERIADVSHRGVYGEETSGIRYRAFVPGLSILLAKRFFTRLTRMYMVRRFHPLVLCYAMSVIVLFFGVFGMSVAMSGPEATLVDGMHGVAVAILGILFLLLGLAYDVRENEGLVVNRTRPMPDLPVTPPVSRPVSEIAVGLASDGGDSEHPTTRDDGEST